MAGAGGHLAVANLYRIGQRDAGASSTALKRTVTFEGRFDLTLTQLRQYP